MFSADYPALFSGPARLLYLPFSEKVAPALRVELFPLSEGFVGFPDSSAAPWDYEGYVYQFTASAQALRQLFVRLWLAPALSRRNRTMLTYVAAEGLEVRLKMMCRVSKSEVHRPASAGWPWGRNAVMGSDAGLAVSEVVRDLDVWETRHPCESPMGTTPGYGESHFRFAPDSRPLMGQLVPSDDVDALACALRDRRDAIEQ